jgi:thioredoxin 1
MKPGVIMRRIVFCMLAGISAVALAAPRPYDESADAKADVQHALSSAASNHLPVLIVFGANWCEDCRVLDRALHKGQSAELMTNAFNVVKVNVGNFDRNLDLAATYGNPIRRGIPAVVVVTDDNRVLYTTKAGELANAGLMSSRAILEFFRRVSQVVYSSN